MKNSHAIPLRTRLLRTILRAVFRALFRIFSRPSITGKENIPSSGPYLIAINHVSLYEAPFVIAFWPVAPEGAGASDIWNRTGQSTLVRLYGGIPIRRGEYNRQVLEDMLGILRHARRPLLIAPEGGRSHTPGMRRGLPGVAYLVEKSQVPVVPVGIVGSTDDFLQEALRLKRPRIEMHIGKPVYLYPPGEEKPVLSPAARRAERQKNVDEIMLHIAALLPPEYQGVYANPSQFATEAEKRQNPT